mgnify:CR=1 FL=1
MSRKTIIIAGICGLILLVILAWLFIESTKPLPGEKQADDGRGHIAVGTEVKYKTNPPTSGQHYEDWTRAGIYDEPKDDRNLVHSLEHGYIVMYYKCGLDTKEATDSARLNNQCKERKEQLAQVYNNKGQRKLIMVPRVNLDTNFAITAWDYLDKFNDFDKSRVEKFIDTHRNQGPEKTME